MTWLDSNLGLAWSLKVKTWDLLMTCKHVTYPHLCRQLFLKVESHSACKQEEKEEHFQRHANFTHYNAHSGNSDAKNTFDWSVVWRGSIPPQRNGKSDSRLQWLSPVCCFVPQMWLNKFHHKFKCMLRHTKMLSPTQHHWNGLGHSTKTLALVV